jgi:glutamine synthetase
VFFKYMVRSIAERHGMRATFMPKPFAHLTGSGCHAHISLWQGGANAFAGDDALGLSPLAHHFLGGLVAHAEALCALTNPAVNSYKRINAPVTASGATWSPSTVSWGGNNRTHMVRVPGPGRMEYRLADGAANPYLLQAGLLAAGLDGIAARRDPGKRLDLDMYVAGHAIEGARRLPLNLLDAIRALQACAPLNEALGAPFMAAYLRLKQQEWDAYSRHLTQWERDSTLDC